MFSGFRSRCTTPLAVDVLQRVADAERDVDGALDGQFLLLDQDLAQQPAVHPLHDHVDPAAVFVVIHLHHAGVIELLADLFFALESGRRTADRPRLQDGES